MRDALGSVTGTVDPVTGTVRNTYRYKPSGELLAKTGTDPDPRFGWNGTHGYRQTGLAHSSHYVQARHLAKEEGRWTTVDPLWPEQPAYTYADQAPTVKIDPTGKACNPTIKGTFNVTDCKTKCDKSKWWCDECTWLLQYHMKYKIDTTGCNNCKVFQFVRYNNGTPWGRDMGKPPKWPLQTCNGGGCVHEDWPSFSGIQSTCKYSINFGADFVTCVCCDNGVKCVSSSYKHSFANCAGPICKTTGPVVVMAPGAAQWCKDAK